MIFTDSLGAALALSAAGAVFAASERSGVDPFLAVFVILLVSYLAVSPVVALIASDSSSGWSTVAQANV